MKKTVLRQLKTVALIILGSLIFGFAFNWMYVPNDLSMGGLTGVSQIINYFFPQVPIGVMVFILNVPLFILSYKYEGHKMLLESLFAMTVSSIFIDLIPMFIDFKPVGDSLLACIFGGVMVGVGIGILLSVGATTGGTELAARLLKIKFKHISIGRIVMFIDLVVIGSYFVVSKSVSSVLYALVALYISTVAIDALIYGRNTSKVACIICEDGEVMREKLLGLELGVTEVKVKGAYSGNDKDMFICAFKPSKISALKSAIIDIDKQAFVIICKADDVFGEGFEECKMNSL